MMFLCLSSNDVNSSRALTESSRGGIVLAQANPNVAMSFCNSSFPRVVLKEYFSGRALASRGVTADENVHLDLD